jgi:Kef-type K+ transport system membrane component KefB
LTGKLAFLVGLICPHDGGFAIRLTEKIEDLVSALFLPLYFALSGLGTNLGLLNDGITWAYVIGVTAVAFAGKIIGGTLAARACKLVWRESFTIGVLMSCKGLVELIVLVSASFYSRCDILTATRTLAYKPKFFQLGLSPYSLSWHL